MNTISFDDVETAQCNVLTDSQAPEASIDVKEKVVSSADYIRYEILNIILCL